VPIVCRNRVIAGEGDAMEAKLDWRSCDRGCDRGDRSIPARDSCLRGPKECLSAANRFTIIEGEGDPSGEPYSGVGGITFGLVRRARANYAGGSEAAD